MRDNIRYVLPIAVKQNNNVKAFIYKVFISEFLVVTIDNIAVVLDECQLLQTR
jgi:hypothetical protein